MKKRIMAVLPPQQGPAYPTDRGVDADEHEAIEGHETHGANGRSGIMGSLHPRHEAATTVREPRSSRAARSCRSPLPHHPACHRGGLRAVAGPTAVGRSTRLDLLGADMALAGVAGSRVGVVGGGASPRGWHGERGRHRRRLARASIGITRSSSPRWLAGSDSARRVAAGRTAWSKSVAQVIACGHAVVRAA